MTENQVEICGLYKQFGSNRVINGLDLTVPKGSVYGFLGQNGAGKTTVMKMLLGLLKPDGGSMKICGEPVCYGQTSTNRFVGFLPDVPEFYSYMRPMEYLVLCGEITGISRDESKKRAGELLHMVGLERAVKKIGGFSRGMKQRLGIAQALLNRPRLLICDEPTSALDPVGRKEILDILAELRGQTTILFSTHILSDVERICDRAAILHQGNLVLEGLLEELKEKKGSTGLTVSFASKKEMDSFFKLEETKDLLIGAKLKDSTAELSLQNMEGAKARLYKAFAKSGIYPEKVEQMESSLENLFMQATKEGVKNI